MALQMYEAYFYQKYMNPEYEKYYFINKSEYDLFVSFRNLVPFYPPERVLVYVGSDEDYCFALNGRQIRWTRAQDYQGYEEYLQSTASRTEK